MTFIKIPFANGGDKQEIPQAVQSDGAVSFASGYTESYSIDPTEDPVNAKNVERSKMNYLLNLITTELNQYQTHGVPEFITAAANGGTAFSYGKGVLVRYDSEDGYNIYRSIVANNTDLPTVTASWQALTGSGTGVTMEEVNAAIASALAGFTAPGGRMASFETAGTSTWTVPSDVSSCRVVVIGGGGGSYSYTTDSTPEPYAGGNGGGFCEKVCTSLTPGGSVTVTVGAGGNGYKTPNLGTASSGSSSSFGSFCSATGGGPSNSSTVGIGTGGRNVRGSHGFVSGNLVSSGFAPYSTPTIRTWANTATSAVDGQSAGSGGVCGGDGAAGAVIIYY